MTKKTSLLLCLMVHLFAFGQKDSIYIKADLSARILRVKEKIVYQNTSQKYLSSIKLLNLVAAYQNRHTNLLRRKLEDRKTDLYYAKENELGKLLHLTINNNTITENLNEENLYIPLEKTLKTKEKTILNLEYSIKIPDAKFTGYGAGENEYLLKNFFLVPDSFDRNNETDKHFVDIEENYNTNTFYKIDFSSSSLLVTSNLPEVSPKIFSGIINNDVEINISTTPTYKLTTEIDGKKHIVDFGYSVSEEDQKNIEFYVPLQLKFLKDKIGFLPEKIFISNVKKKKNDFFGNDDIKFWKYKLQLFTDPEKIDMDYFSIISQELADQLFFSNKKENHWINNGLKTYWEIQYLEKFYKDYKLLGNLIDYKILGIKPLKYSFFSKLNLSERYGLAYQYIMAQNLDQNIDENLESLSNFNEIAISKFETGTLLNFISEKMGKDNFEDFVRDYIAKNDNKLINKEDFLNEMAMKSGYSSSFMETYIQRKMRVNFKIKSFDRIDDQLHIKLSKNITQNIPFKLKVEDSNGNEKTYWYDTNNKKGENTYIIPDNDVTKITVNSNYVFPESNFRDNYLYTKGLFSNTKKVKFKLFTDKPNPEYNEIFYAPKFNWNNYDKFLLGLKFHNKSIIESPFLYAITPYYSTGTQKFTGMTLVSYKIQPAESFFRSITLAYSAAFFHYDYDLTYKRFGASASMALNKNPRSQIARSIVLSYNHFDRELSEVMQQKNDYSKYNIWNIGFVYSENNVILEKYLFGNLQIMDDYQKLTAESFYRWEYAKDKKISFRFFGGLFLTNHTRNNTFNLGISKVSNYSFSYNLLAQSASTGILSQQFVLAEGGFKSLINGTVNQWIASSNVDAHVWKMFNVYADAGIYKNKTHDPKFIWDSGIKLKVIPDFLEIYFPLQSSLGFEPGFKNYSSRIRYTLNVNLNAVIGHFRRGWY
ncbi:aminopeptidase [Cloacibacterium sp.]|uniref:aminopeptidase n=1 Tax=Cloacibacterium sp. TaxID=1913682 RepID=UPI0039E5C167